MFGCDIALVREIVPFRHPTRLPGAPAYVAGLINLRGTVVTVVDLGVRLGVGPVNRDEGSIVLIEHGATVVGLGVDEVRDVQLVADEHVEAPHADADVGGVVSGLARVGEDVVALLDVRAIVGQVLL